MLYLFNEQYNLLDQAGTEYDYETSKVVQNFKSSETFHQSQKLIVQWTYPKSSSHEKQHNRTITSIFYEEPSEITSDNIKNIYAEFAAKHFGNIHDDIQLHDISRRHFMIKYLISQNLLPCAYTLYHEIKNIQMEIFKLQNLEKLQQCQDLGLAQEMEIQARKYMQQFQFICVNCLNSQNPSLSCILKASKALYNHIQEVILRIFTIDSTFGNSGIQRFIDSIMNDSSFQLHLQACENMKQLLFIIYYLYLYNQQVIILNADQEQLEKFASMITALQDSTRVEKLANILQEMYLENSQQPYEENSNNNYHQQAESQEHLENFNLTDNNHLSVQQQLFQQFDPTIYLMQFIDILKSLQVDNKLYMFEKTLGDEERKYIQKVLYGTRFRNLHYFIDQAANLLPQTEVKQTQGQSGQHSQSSNRGRGGAKKSHHSGKKRGRR